MTRQSFPAGAAPTVRIRRVSGDLTTCVCKQWPKRNSPRLQAT